MCFLACGSIEMKNRTNTQLVLTLVKCPGFLSFNFLKFFQDKVYIFFYALFHTDLGEDRAAFNGKSLIQHVDRGQVDI